MSDETMREAVLEEFAHDAGVHRVWGVAGMADEILRLRDEIAALRGAVERVRALHARVQPKYFPAVCEHCDSRSYPCDTIAALEETP